MEKGPLVSIILPVYNAEDYIKRSIESAINQTYKNIELIVIDDGSTDKTADIIKSFHDPRIIYLYQENQWLGAARNNGIKISRGEYITFLDADDIYLPEKIEKQVEFLQTRPEYKVAYCNFISFYSEKPSKLIRKKRKHPSGNILNELLESSLINPNTLMVHSSVLKKIGLFNEKRYNPEDWDMWLRISQGGYEFGYLDKDLVIVEIRGDSLTRWQNQPIYKKNALEMLEKIFSQMTEEEKHYYESERILRKEKFKLAIAYLVNKQKKEFFRNFTGGSRFTILAYLIGGIILLIPSAFLRTFIIKLWIMNQRRAYRTVSRHIDLQLGPSGGLKS